MKCKTCEKDFNPKHFNSKYCSPKCRKIGHTLTTLEFLKKRQVIKNEKFNNLKEGYDYITCPICLNKMLELNNVHAKSHGFNTPRELADCYGIDHVVCEKKRNKVKGENNPGYKHGGKLSPWSKKSKYYSKESHNKALNNGIRKPENNAARIEYWLKQTNGNLKEASELLSNHQSNGLKKMVELYGEEDGHKRWVDRNQKWHVSLKKSGLHSGISKVATELFEEIFKQVPDIKYGKNEISIRTKNRVYLVDCCHKQNKKIIEFFGDFWHANPNFFKEDDKIKNRLVGDIWKHDNEKILELKNKGYDVLVVWEKDFRDNEDMMINKCITFLKGTND